MKRICRQRESDKRNEKQATWRDDCAARQSRGCYQPLSIRVDLIRFWVRPQALLFQGIPDSPIVDAEELVCASGHVNE